MKLQVGFLFLSYSTLFDWLSNQIKVVTDNDHVVERNLLRWIFKVKLKKLANWGNKGLIKFLSYSTLFDWLSNQIKVVTDNDHVVERNLLRWIFKVKLKKLANWGNKGLIKSWLLVWKLQTWCTHPPLDKGSSLLFKNIFHLLWIPKCFFLWFALDSWGFGYGRCSRIGERFKAKRWEDY